MSVRDTITKVEEAPFELGEFYFDEIYQLFYCFSKQANKYDFKCKLLNVNDIVTSNINNQTFKVMNLTFYNCWLDASEGFKYIDYKKADISKEHREFCLNNINYFLNIVKVETGIKTNV